MSLIWHGVCRFSNRSFALSIGNRDCLSWASVLLLLGFDPWRMETRVDNAGENYHHSFLKNFL